MADQKEHKSGLEEDVVRADTDRAREREEEDQDYVPVIIKRTDEARRHPDDTLEKAITEGHEQLTRRFFSLLMSSAAAGLILGFTAMAAAAMIVISQPWELEGLTRLLTALVYPLGFILVILGSTQLFTEHTATAVYPVLDQVDRVWRLLRLWAIVIVGNLLGALVAAGLLTLAEPVIGARAGYLELGHHLVGVDTLPLLTSSLLAGWLMALGAWLVLGTSHTSGQIICIYFVTFLIGLGGLHHSIAGAVEMFTALLNSNEFHIGESVRFIALALLGNLIGGSMFVAVLNYAHIRGLQNEDE